MAINKVIYKGKTLIDLTGTTATAETILQGFGAYGKDGEWMEGTLKPKQTAINVCTEFAFTQQKDSTPMGIAVETESSGKYKATWIMWKNADSRAYCRLQKNGEYVGKSHILSKDQFGDHFSEILSLSEGDRLEIHAKSGSASQTVYVGNLVIEEVEE